MQAQLEHLTQLQTQLATLTNLGPQTRTPEAHRQEQDFLQAQITQLQAQLSRASAELRRQFTPVTIDQVQAQLPANAVLIGFMLYQPFNPTAERQKRWGEERYAVYLLTPQGQIHTADLGPAKEA